MKPNKLDVENYVEEKLNILKDKLDRLTTASEKSLIIFANMEDVATQSYVRSKVKLGARLGINVIPIPQENMKLFEYLNSNIPTILQLPCNDKSLIEFYNAKYYYRDVDGFFNFKDIYEGNLDAIIPATPKGITQYLIDLYSVRGGLKNKTVTILGRGFLVGQPLVQLLLKRVGTLNVCTSQTNDYDELDLFKKSDIVVTATGKESILRKFIPTDNMLRVYIDTGIMRGADGKLQGELGDINKLKSNGYVLVTPVPKGVGLLTTWSLFENVYLYYSKHRY